jgi:hypothetical protein
MHSACPVVHAHAMSEKAYGARLGKDTRWPQAPLLPGLPWSHVTSRIGPHIEPGLGTVGNVSSLAPARDLGLGATEHMAALSLTLAKSAPRDTHTLWYQHFPHQVHGGHSHNLRCHIVTRPQGGHHYRVQRKRRTRL